MENGAFLVPPRLPLGEFYRGECRAASASHFPSGDTATKYCNNGYARSACDRFPNDSPTDAVRFHIASLEPATLQIHWVLEKNCWPAGNGLLDYSRRTGQFLSVHPDSILQRQAEAFLTSFLARIASTT
jgi:hypothetical protein